MNTTLYIVPPESHNHRLDAFLSHRSLLTRSRIQKLIKEKMVTVNSVHEKTGYRLKEGDMIELTVPDIEINVLTPEDIPIDVLWEDDYMIVVNKPPHMVVHPAAGNPNGTLMNALAARCNRLSSVGAPLRPGVVHRLDKDTSGVIVIAKDDVAHHNLVEQFKEREVQKYYTALLFSNMREDSGEINSSIGRSLANRKKMSVKSKWGKEAITRFEVTQRFKVATLVKIRILTGRTHQIRVHFASVSKPVLGDKTYGKKTSLVVGNKTLTFKRQMLHAQKLIIRHPIHNDIMEFNAPLPADMADAIQELTDFAEQPGNMHPDRSGYRA